MFPKEHLQYMSFKNITLTFIKSSNCIQYDVMCQSTLTSLKIIFKQVFLIDIKIARSNQQDQFDVK